MEIKKNLTTQNFNTGNIGRIKYIVIHYTANNGDTALGNTNYFKSYRGASAHYFVDETSIYQSIEDKNIAWHCGANHYKHPYCRNSNSIGVELCSRKGKNYYFKDETVTNAVWLVKYLMAKYNVPITNVIRHYDVTGKICPEPYVRDSKAWQNFKAISRFSRNTTDCLEIVRTLLNLNIPVYFEKENINTGSMESELFLSILSSMAEGESTSISENNKWSIKKRFENGTYKLGYVPYGYSWVNGEIKVNPVQERIVKRIFSELLSGKGTDAIAKELNKEHVPSKKGGRWNSSSIRVILANEKYTGDCIFQKTYTDSNFNRHRNDGNLDQYFVPDHHEAIVSHEDFDAAAALIKQRASEKSIERGTTKYQKRYAFSGKIVCGNCGDTFRRRSHKSTHGNYIAWVCNTHLADSSKCSMLYLRDDDLKLAFATMLNKLIYCYKLVLKPYLEALQSNTGDEVLLRIQQLEKLLEQNAEQRETLHKLMGQGYIDPILFTQENNALLSQANNLRSDIEALNRLMTGDTTKVYETERLIHFCKRGEMLHEYSEELFEMFVDHIHIYTRQKVGFVLKCGLTFKERI